MAVLPPKLSSMQWGTGSTSGAYMKADTTQRSFQELSNPGASRAPARITSEVGRRGVFGMVLPPERMASVLRRTTMGAPLAPQEKIQNQNQNTNNKADKSYRHRIKIHDGKSAAKFEIFMFGICIFEIYIWGILILDFVCHVFRPGEFPGSPREARGNRAKNGNRRLARGIPQISPSGEIAGESGSGEIPGRRGKNTKMTINIIINDKTRQQ